MMCGYGSRCMRVLMYLSTILLYSLMVQKHSLASQQRSVSFHSDCRKKTPKLFTATANNSFVSSELILLGFCKKLILYADLCMIGNNYDAHVSPIFSFKMLSCE